MAYKGTWEQFETQLQNADCSVIGINDYFSVAGYKKIKEKITNEKLDIGEKKILPVVEMRMTDSLQNKKITKGPTHFNFHIIFSEKIHVNDIEIFIKSLKCDGTIIGEEDYKTKQKLKEKKVSFDNTLEILKNDKKFEDKFLIWLPYNEYGGIADINPESDGWIKRRFYKKISYSWLNKSKTNRFFSFGSRH